jgi:hypothetical protein
MLQQLEFVHINWSIRGENAYKLKMHSLRLFGFRQKCHAKSMRYVRVMASMAFAGLGGN